MLEWGFDGLVAPGTSRARGVAILFKNTFEYKISNVKKCPIGNYLLVDIEILNKSMTLGAVYGPNEDNPIFYEYVFQEIESIGNDYIILGGDWNLVLNHNIDYHSYQNINNKRARTVVMEEKGNFDLIEIWRVRNNDQKQFTWSTDNFLKRAGLDFFLVSNC